MTEKRKILVCWMFALVAAGVAIAALIPTYWVQSSSYEELVCNQNECFIFVRETSWAGWGTM
jgi:hypothetical protein